MNCYDCGSSDVALKEGEWDLVAREYFSITVIYDPVDICKKCLTMIIIQELEAADRQEIAKKIQLDGELKQGASEFNQTLARDANVFDAQVAISAIKDRIEELERQVRKLSIQIEKLQAPRH